MADYAEAAKIADEAEAEEQVPGLIEEQMVMETNYVNEGKGSAGTAGGGSIGSVGSAGEGSLVSKIPLTDDDILEQLKNLDAEARERATKIQLMRDSIMRYQEAEHMTDEIAQKLEMKQQDLLIELQEFDRITIEIQRLIGLAEASGISLVLSGEGVPGEKPTMIKGPPVKEMGFIASGAPGTIAEYLTDRTAKVIIANFRGGIPQVIMLDSPRKGGACQPLSIEGLDALARKNKKNLSRSIASQRSAPAPTKYSQPCRPTCPPSPINLGCLLQGKLQCLQAEIEQLRDENGKLNNLIVQMVEDNLQERSSSLPCPQQPCRMDLSHPPPCISPPCRPPPCPTPPCPQRRALPCASPPCKPPPCPPPPCRPLPCPPAKRKVSPCILPPCPPPPCPQPPCRPTPCPPKCHAPPCPPPPCPPPTCRPSPCSSAPCSTPSSVMCPNYLAQQMDKLEQELQELQQLLACERMELELDKLKKLKATCKSVPCSLLPRCPPKPCK